MREQPPQCANIREKPVGIFINGVKLDFFDIFHKERDACRTLKAFLLLTRSWEAGYRLHSARKTEGGRRNGGESARLGHGADGLIIEWIDDLYEQFMRQFCQFDPSLATVGE